MSNKNNKAGQNAVEMASAPMGESLPETGQEAIHELIVENDSPVVVGTVAGWTPMSRMFPWLGRAHWNTSVTKPGKPFEGVTEKGTIQQGLAEGAIEYLDIEGNANGAMLPVRIVAKKPVTGKTAYVMLWPSTGGGPAYAKKVINVKNAPAASAELDRLARAYFKDYEAYRKDEVARLGPMAAPVQASGPTTTAAVELDDDAVNDLGFFI